MTKGIKVKDKSGIHEGLKVAPFKKNIRKTKPHKHNNYFEIIYLTKGAGSHTIDTKEYEIKPPVIFTIRKEQLHFWDINTEPDGFVIIIKKSFVENCLDNDIKRLISELSAHTCLFPKNNKAVDIFKLLFAEFQTSKNSSRQLVDGLLKALLAKLLESATPHISKKGNSTIFKRYLEFLSNENELSNKVSYYAELLNTSPQNLNAICRKESGQSSSEILTEHIVNEAKRLLLYSDFTVNEIAHKLDFKDNSHFSKYFKRQLSFTPTDFRKINS